MRIERTKNAIRNTKWGFLQRLANILLPFVVRTVLIHTLGAEYGGLSSLFTSILSILSLTELGFSSAIVYSMYKPIAEDDKDKICALLNVYRKAYLVIGSIILAIGLMLVPVLPKLIKDDVPADVNLYVLYGIYLINNVISYFLYGYKTSLLSAHQREDVLSKNILLYTLALYGAQCVMLLAFKDFYLFTILIPLSTVLLNILNNRAVSQMFPDYRPRGTIGTADRDELKKNLTGLMFSKVGAATRNTFDSIVVSMFLGLTSVAMYNNYFYIVSGVNAFLVVLMNAITAGVGNKIAVDSPESNYEDFNMFHFLYMWLAGWCTVCMMCLYQPFMRLWMGESLMFPNYIMFLFCYYFMMMKQGDISSVYYSAAGLWWHGKLRFIIEAFLNLSLNFVLGKYYGVAGIILATIISFTCIYFYGSKFLFTEYFKNGKLGKFYVDNVLYMLATGLVGFCTFTVVEWLTGAFASPLLVLVTRLLVCLLLPNVLFLLVYGISHKNRDYISRAVSIVRNQLGL